MTMGEAKNTDKKYGTSMQCNLLTTYCCKNESEVRVNFSHQVVSLLRVPTPDGEKGPKFIFHQIKFDDNLRKQSVPGNDNPLKNHF